MADNFYIINIICLIAMKYKKYVEKLKNIYTSKESLVDTASRVLYSLTVGALNQYSGKSLSDLIFQDIQNPDQDLVSEIALSRLYATGVNTITGGPYRKWKEFMYRLTKTTKEHSKLRRELVDFLSFNTFENPVYISAVSVSQLLTRGEIDLDEVLTGSLILAMFSPFVSTTMNNFMDWCRKRFKIKSTVETAYEK